VAITNLQQARQLYAMGQRVAKTMDGSRPGYKGGADMGTVEDSRGQRSATTANVSNTGNVTTSSPRGQGPGPDDRSSALQTYNHNIATGQEDKNPYGPVPYNDREKILATFKNTRPDVKVPPVGIMKFLEKPIQMFSDFTTGKNRAFFEDVIRAGKIPGVNFGTVSEMTPEQLEAAYQSYMSNRMSGQTDAYGNPLVGYRQKDNEGIASVYDNNMFVDDNIIDDSVTTDLFTSRFLQNQPEDIRAEIEERMQNYYTV